MKKRIFCLILALVMVLSLAACAGSGNDNTENTKDTTTNTEGSEATTPVSGGEAELALITDANSIDDRGFNQFSWEGLKQYAERTARPTPTTPRSTSPRRATSPPLRALSTTVQSSS